MKFNQLLFFLICVIFFSCKKDKDNEPNPIQKTPDFSYKDTIDINSQFQFSGIINSEFVSYVQGVNSAYVIGGGVYNNSDEPNSSTCFFGCSMNEPGTFRIGFNKGVLHYNGEFPSYSEGFDFYALGNYGFCDLWEDGFTLSYKDISGVEWRTDLGTKDQTGSFAKIADRKFLSTGPSVDNFKVLIEFNCNLYNLSGQSIKVEKGIFVGRIGMIKSDPI